MTCGIRESNPDTTTIVRAVENGGKYPSGIWA